MYKIFMDLFYTYGVPAIWITFGVCLIFIPIELLVEYVHRKKNRSSGQSLYGVKSKKLNALLMAGVLSIIIIVVAWFYGWSKVNI